MAIERNAGGGKFINSPGDYKVKVTELKTGLSKKQQPMLTVTLQTDEEQSMNAYFVKALPFHMKALDLLKQACGVNRGQQADELIGKCCGIKVEAGEPNLETGKVFMQIVGYGPSEGVTSVNNQSDDSIPF